MPTPDQKMQMDTSKPSIVSELFGKSARDNLASEISALRQEIAALRAELAPVPSLIVTGRQALDEFRRLANVR